MSPDAPTPVAGAVTIQRATMADAATLAEFGARTFHDTFAADNRPDDMAAHLASAFGLPQQTAELTDPDYVTIFAMIEGTLAGFAQVRRKEAPACVDGPLPFELHRFYVDRPWHGKGVAAPLMASCADVIRELGGRTVWLSVWEHNARGRAFYAKCGFRQTGTTEFWLGPDCQTDHVLERALS